ncbi:ABC transporter permease [Pseudolactococcus plantarum]|nr:ABC transporter permease [Lactococcus plantarum]HCN75047.1 ABC transporter permease [Lactococcus sp.]
MKFLNLKLRRDFRRNWTQFFSVFLMAFLSILIFVGLQGAWHGLEVSLNRYINDSDLADSWVMSTGFNKQDIEQINAIKGIKQTGKSTRVQLQAARGTKKEKQLYLDTFDAKLTKPHIVKGEQLQENKHGIWLNIEYAKANKIKVGDSRRFSFQGKDVFLTVLGLVQSADRIYFTGTEEFISPNHSDYGYGYLSQPTLIEDLGYQGKANMLELKGQPKQIREKLSTILGSRLLAYNDRHTLVDVSDALDRVGQIRNLSYLFSFIFILLAILAMYTTIRRMIETQEKEIAILKALGFSNWKIGWHYTSFGLLVGGTGAVLGAMISPVMSWFVLGTQQEMFSLPSWTIAYSLSSACVIILVLSVCILASYLASRGAIKGLPAEFLRGNKQKAGRKVLLERVTSLWQVLRFEQRWAIRDALSNKVRLLMGIIGVAFGMMLLIAGIGMPQSINHLVDKAYHKDFNYDIRLHMPNYDTVKNNYPKGQWVDIKQAQFTPDDGYNRLLIVMSDGDYVNIKTESGKSVKSDGIYVTKDFAKRANLTVGQTLKVTPYLDGKQYQFDIKGIITSETNQGAYLTQKAFEKANGRFSPSTLLVRKGDYDHDIESDQAVVSSIKMQDQEKNANDFVASLMSIFLMIVGFAILLVVVVLYNLGSLNFVERSRDYATLSVLGFKKQELRQITMLENIGTTAIGWCLGLPLGFWFLDTYVQTFSTIKLAYTPYVTWHNILLSTIIVVVCAMSTTLFISRRIKHLDMVQALKGNE